MFQEVSIRLIKNITRGQVEAKGVVGLIDLDDELFEIKRAVAHLDLGLKAYRAAARDEIDASRLLESINEEFGKLISRSEEAQEKIRGALRIPAAVEG